VTAAEVAVVALLVLVLAGGMLRGVIGVLWGFGRFAGVLLVPAAVVVVLAAVARLVGPR
jgi:hypothetical protein